MNKVNNELIKRNQKRPHNDTCLIVLSDHHLLINSNNSSLIPFNGSLGYVLECSARSRTYDQMPTLNDMHVPKKRISLKPLLKKMLVVTIVSPDAPVHR